MKTIEINDKNLKFQYVVCDNGDVYNKTTQKKLSPSKDPRRPEESPIIYFKTKDNKRTFQYQDELIFKAFNPEFRNTSIKPIHKDGNITNCSLDNLYYADGITLLKEYYHETKEWKKIFSIPNLFYDYYICEDGRLFNATTNSFIQPFYDEWDKNQKHPRYTLYIYGENKKKGTKHFRMDKLVAENFVLKQNETKSNIIHKDGNWYNTSKENLYWGDALDMIVKEAHPENIFTKLNDPILGKEKWKKLKFFDDEFEDEYLISNYGRVYNNTKKFYSKPMPSTNKNLYNQSYQWIGLLKKGDHTGTKYLLHRLVAYNFCKNKDYKKYNFVNHINGNPECNLAINLEWVTRDENVEHALSTNLQSSSLYIKNKEDYDDWTMRIFYAWIYNSTKDNMSDKLAYDFFVYYATNYDKTLPDLTYDEFVEKHKKLLKDDKDFQTLNNFYKEYLK